VIRAFHRSLVLLCAVVLLANAILAPAAMAHGMLSHHPDGRSSAPASQEQPMPAPCHEGGGGTVDPEPRPTTCCFGHICACAGVSVMLTVAGDREPPARPLHDRTLDRVCVPAPEALPDFLLRPPIR
jgi:hypothetical protein